MRCPECKGYGGWWHGYGGNETDEICTDCSGSGEVEDLDEGE